MPCHIASQDVPNPIYEGSDFLWLTSSVNLWRKDDDVRDSGGTVALIQFLGATQTVTGSRHLLEVDGYRVLIDCGLFQGLKELRLRNWEPLLIPPSTINAVILT